MEYRIVKGEQNTSAARFFFIECLSRNPYDIPVFRKIYNTLNPMTDKWFLAKLPVLQFGQRLVGTGMYEICVDPMSVPLKSEQFAEQVYESLISKSNATTSVKCHDFTVNHCLFINPVNADDHSIVWICLELANKDHLNVSNYCSTNYEVVSNAIRDYIHRQDANVVKKLNGGIAE